MGKNYTQSTASLKTITHDTFVLDARKIMIYPGSGDKMVRVNLIDSIKDAESKIASVSSDLSEVANNVTTLETSTNSSISAINTTLETTAKTNVANTFTAVNTFNSTATIKGAATFNSTITKSTTSSDPSSLATTQVLNKAENNKLYPQLTADNTLTGFNTFEQMVTTESGLQSEGDVVVSSGNVYVNKNATITFLDDGEVTISNGASGYLYEMGIPEILDNGRIYDLGTITQETDLSSVVFNGDDTIVQTCEIWFTTGDIPYNIIWPIGTIWIDYEDGSMPSLYSNMKYRISVRNEITDIVASISYTYPVR